MLLAFVLKQEREAHGVRTVEVEEGRTMAAQVMPNMMTNEFNCSDFPRPCRKRVSVAFRKEVQEP